MDQLIEYPTDKEIQLQRYIQSLYQELQVTKLSLQEALVEINKQGMNVILTVYTHKRSFCGRTLQKSLKC